MSAATYDEAVRRLLVHEGGYSNHPSDPGGPTNFGITIADYRRYVKERNRGRHAGDVGRRGENNLSQTILGRSAL